MDIKGSFDEKFASARDLFEQNFAEHGDVGASFAVTVEGEFVVDIWGGHRDAAGSEPWEEDTIVNVYSTTKTMAAHHVRPGPFPRPGFGKISPARPTETPEASGSARS